MNRRSKSTKASTVDLRAFREQRSAELAATTDPTGEAQRHEANFLKGIRTAQDELRWLVEHEAWLTLGFESPVDWWVTRVRPVFVALDVKPSPEMAEQILEAARAHERALPAAQRRTKRELAESVLASEWITRGRRQDRSERRDAAGADLGRADIVDAEIVDDNPEQVGAHAPRDAGQEEPVESPLGDSSIQTAAEQGAGEHVLPADGVETKKHPVEDTPAPAGGVEQSPPAGVTPQDPPVAAVSNDRSALVAQQPGPNASSDDAESFSPPEEPGDRYNSDEGDKSGEAAIPPAVSPDLVHIDHPSATGEAPAGSEVPPRAGERPSDVGEASGDETAEGSVPPESSAVDPNLRVVEQWIAATAAMKALGADEYAEIALNEHVRRADAALHDAWNWLQTVHGWRVDFGYEKPAVEEERA